MTTAWFHVRPGSVIGAVTSDRDRAGAAVATGSSGGGSSNPSGEVTAGASSVASEEVGGRTPVLAPAGGSVITIGASGGSCGAVRTPVRVAQPAPTTG